MLIAASSAARSLGIRIMAGKTSRLQAEEYSQAHQRKREHKIQCMQNRVVVGPWTPPSARVRILRTASLAGTTQATRGAPPEEGKPRPAFCVRTLGLQMP